MMMMMSPFGTISTHDGNGQTDGRTDTRRQHTLRGNSFHANWFTVRHS